jgi:outer membrane biosynthesis protein TonB
VTPVSRMPTSRLMSVMTVVSVALHIGLLVGFVGLGSCGPKKQYPDEAIIKTRLVKLGKQRDEKLLPRIDKSPPPPAPTPAAKVPTPVPPAPEKPVPQKTEPVKPEPKRSASDVLQKFTEKNPEKRDLSELIQDKFGEVVDEGHKEGSEIGTEITGRMKAEYNDRIMAKIKSALSVPSTISEQERLFLKTQLAVSIDSDGALTDASIARPSGNAGYDNAVLAAAKKAAPFPPPPLPVRAFYADGVGMNVCPISCR